VVVVVVVDCNKNRQAASHSQSVHQGIIIYRHGRGYKAITANSMDDVAKQGLFFTNLISIVVVYLYIEGIGF
jgi:hypothetical protein